MHMHFAYIQQWGLMYWIFVTTLQRFESKEHGIRRKTLNQSFMIQNAPLDSPTVSRSSNQWNWNWEKSLRNLQRIGKRKKRENDFNTFCSSYASVMTSSYTHISIVIFKISARLYRAGTSNHRLLVCWTSTAVLWSPSSWCSTSSLPWSSPALVLSWWSAEIGSWPSSPAESSDRKSLDHN